MHMRIGVPKEVKPGEGRVALTPAGAAAFVAHGHSVLVEQGAGLGSGLLDEAYAQAGAELVHHARAVWERADLVMKVKEPVGEELAWLRRGQVLYTYLHLASNSELTHRLAASGVTAFAYETIQLPDGSLPLLIPMSEVAGRLSVQKGAQCLEAIQGGAGILLGGVASVRPAKVVILGAGVAGSNACFIAVGMGAQVTVLDIDPAKLRYLHDIMGGRVVTVMSNRATVAEEIAEADLVIGCVLVPGAKAPTLVTEDMVRAMRANAAIVDVAIDQGGCVATSRPTTHADPTFRMHHVVHYCVTNMPGAVPRTSTFALTSVTLTYGLELADRGWGPAIAASPALRRGLNIHDGRVTCKPVAEACGMDYHEVTP